MFDPNHKLERLKLLNRTILNFLIDNPSLQIAKQKEFTISGNCEQSLIWEDYGFKLHFSYGTIESSEKCHVTVAALVGGHFQFPPRMELVSAIYFISFSKELLKPAKLEIQHCVSLKSEQQAKFLKFIRASLDDPVPPYKFQYVEGGTFEISTQYGTVSRYSFSPVGIGKSIDLDDSCSSTSTTSDIDYIEMQQVSPSLG